MGGQVWGSPQGQEKSGSQNPGNLSREPSQGSRGSGRAQGQEASWVRGPGSQARAGSGTQKVMKRPRSSTKGIHQSAAVQAKHAAV